MISYPVIEWKWARPKKQLPKIAPPVYFDKPATGPRFVKGAMIGQPTIRSKSSAR